MIHLKMVRRGLLRLLVATLFAALAVVVGAPSASADPRCTGQITVLRASDPGANIGIVFANGGTDSVDPGLSASGPERDPIVKFIVWPNQFAIADYFDLRSGQYLGTHTVRPGVYDKNPCHKANVLLWWLAPQRLSVDGRTAVGSGESG